MGAPESANKSHQPPRVFVSYAHENAAHNAWVKSLVRDLRGKGVDALLDEWKVSFGGDFTLFMDSMRTCDRVLLICTPTYARKADEGTGGVGYERQIITAELARAIKTTTFVCVLRSGNAEEAVPTFAQTRRYVDFREDAEYDQRFGELLGDLHGVPVEVEPPLGDNPFTMEETKDGVVAVRCPTSEALGKRARKKGDPGQVGPAVRRVKKRAAPRGDPWQRGAFLLSAGIVLVSLGYGSVRMWIWPSSRQQKVLQDVEGRFPTAETSGQQEPLEDLPSASMKEADRGEATPTPTRTEEPLLVQAANHEEKGAAALPAPDDARHSDMSVEAKEAGLGLGSGDFPEERSVDMGEATNGSVDSLSNNATVGVEDQVVISSEVQLSPTVNPGAFSRCICFDLYADCVSDPTHACQVMDFGPPYHFPGHARALLNVDEADYLCIAAYDPLHTICAEAAVERIDNMWTATFKGDPLVGGNWLVGGNLTGDRNIDVLDAGMYMAEIAAGSSYADGNTDCDDEAPHGDINADGEVDAGDYTFIVENFLMACRSPCCDDAGGAVDEPVVDITISKLEAMGLGYLSVADLNGDGHVNTLDMELYIQGVEPVQLRPAKRARQSEAP